MSNAIDLEPAIQSAVMGLLPELERRFELVAERAVSKAMGDRLLQMREAAPLLGLTYDALKKQVARGSLPVVRQGKTVRIRLSDVLRAADRGDKP